MKVLSASKIKTQAAEPNKNFWTSGTRRRSKTRTLAPPFAGPSWHARGGLRLDLQGLPGMASSLRKDPRLFCDACPAVTLSTLELAVNMEPNPPLYGPVPYLFSRNETKTSSNLKRNPEAIFSGEKIGV